MVAGVAEAGEGRGDGVEPKANAEGKEAQHVDNRRRKPDLVHVANPGDDLVCKAWGGFGDVWVSKRHGKKGQHAGSNNQTSGDVSRPADAQKPTRILNLALRPKAPTKESSFLRWSSRATLNQHVENSQRATRIAASAIAVPLANFSMVSSQSSHDDDFLVVAAE